MHAPTGEIYTEEEYKQIQKQLHADRGSKRANQFFALTEQQYNELEPMDKPKRKNHMRNQPCVCGSGVKFKKCCWSKFL